MPETAGLLESTLRLCGLAVAVTAHLLDRVVAAEPPQPHPCQHRCGVLEAAGRQHWLRTGGGDCPHDRRGEESLSRPSAAGGGRRVVRVAIRNRTPEVGRMSNNSFSNSSGIYICNSGHSSHLSSTSCASNSDSVDSGRLRASSSCPALVSQPSPHARQLAAASHCHTPHLSAPRCQNKQLIDPRSCHIKLATAVNTRCRILQVSGHFLCSSGLLRRSSSRRLSTIWEEEEKDDSQDSWRTHRRQLPKTPSLRRKAAFDAAKESDAKTGRCTRSLGRERARYGYRSRA
jgi:hypothetical protein